MPKPTWKGSASSVEGVSIRFGGVAPRPERQQIQDRPIRREGEEADVGEAVILDAVHTARGRRRGGLSGLHPVDLLAQTLCGALSRAGVDPRQVDDCLIGCVTQTGEQGFNVARGAVLAAGLPIAIPGATINRFCGSGLQAVNSAAQAVQSGAAQLVIAGGVEHMTRTPMGSDSAGGEGPASPGLQQRWPRLVPQGLSAELVAAQWGLGRAECDAYAAQSQARAATAWEEGRFAREILPVRVPAEGGARDFVRDEHPRPGTTTAALAALKPAFREDGVITAGNSSGIVDGAAAVLVASRTRARALGLQPRARVVAMAVAGSDPVLMLTGPIPASQKALAQAGLGVDEIDLFEINEAFAPVPLVVARELGIPLEKVNVNGGAIALGHPLGATGAILLSTALHELERRGGRRALITLCVGYGMGVTTIIDRQVD